MMRIFVTGGRGFIGTHLVRALRARGHEVWIGDVGVWHDPYYIEMDVCSLAQTQRAFHIAAPTLVYHAAAVAGRWRGEARLDTLWQTNVLGTENVLTAADEVGARVVFFSSSEIYGDYDGVITEALPDAQPVRQHNRYGLSKWVGELICLQAAAYRGTEIVRVRPLNVYGPGEPYSPYRSAVIQFIYRALHSQPFPVYTGHTRNFTYVDDVVEALANLTERFRPGAVYNLGAPLACTHTMERVAEIVLGYLGRPMSLAERCSVEQHTTRHKRVDSSLAAREIGLRHTVDLEGGLIRTIQWAREVYAPRKGDEDER